LRVGNSHIGDWGINWEVKRRWWRDNPGDSHFADSKKTDPSSGVRPVTRWNVLGVKLKNEAGWIKEEMTVLKG